jgi:hypothetical protein
MEDMPKWYEISKKVNFIYIDEVLATYVIHGKNVTHTQKFPIIKGTILFLYDHLSEIKFSDTKRTVEHRIALMAAKGELQRKHLADSGIRKVAFGYLFYYPKSFFNIIYFTLKEVGYKWKVKLFR